MATNDEFLTIGEPPELEFEQSWAWNTGYLPHSKLYTDRVYNVHREEREWARRIPVFEIERSPARSMASGAYWVVTVDADDEGNRDTTAIPKVLLSTDHWADLTADDDCDPDGILDVFDDLRERIASLLSRLER